jgi:acetyl-CoA carboxylase carboxyl transferase subunit beta
MAWFKRKEKRNYTATEDKMDVPKGLWYKSPTGKLLMLLERNLFVSQDGFHVRIGSSTYFEILFDNNEFVELDKTYLRILCILLIQKKCRPTERCDGKTKLKDAVRTDW